MERAKARVASFIPNFIYTPMSGRRPPHLRERVRHMCGGFHFARWKARHDPEGLVGMIEAISSLTQVSAMDLIEYFPALRPLIKEKASDIPKGAS